MESNRKIDSELGLFIYNSILSSGMTYEAVAEQLEVSTRTIDYYCSGQRRPKHKTLLKLIKVTGVKTEDIPF